MCGSVLQCVVAVFCSALIMQQCKKPILQLFRQPVTQCLAVSCGESVCWCVVQCVVAVHCIVLQCVTVRCQKQVLHRFRQSVHAEIYEYTHTNTHTHTPTRTHTNTHTHILTNTTMYHSQKKDVLTCCSVCCSVLQCVAVCVCVLQRTTRNQQLPNRGYACMLQIILLQCVVMCCCSALQCVAVCVYMLQRTTSDQQLSKTGYSYGCQPSYSTAVP